MNNPQVWRSISGHATHPMVEVGWTSIGVLELTALPGLPREQRLPWLRAVDVLLVGAGDALFLAHRVRESGREGILAAPSCQGDLDTVRA